MEENKNREAAPEIERKEMKISAQDKADLAVAARWAKFLAIAGFVMLGLGAAGMLFALLAVAVAGVSLPGMAAWGVAGMTAYLGSMLMVTLVYFFPTLYLFRFARKALDAVDSDNSEAMSESWANLRRFFKFVGIFAIVLIAFYIVAIISFGVGAAVARLS